MSYQVLVAFTEAQRDYPKGSVQTFGEWTVEQQAQYIPTLINRGYIQEIVVTPIVTEIPDTILTPQTAQQVIAEAEAYLQAEQGQ